MSILNKNRILSLLLALTVLVALCFSVFSIQIFAEPESDSETEVLSEGESESGVITTGESESESTGESESEAESSGETESSTTPATTDDTSDNSDNGVNVGQIVSFVILGVLVVGVIVFCIIRREKVGKFVKALNSERKKIVWYPWPQTMKSTAVVVVVVLIIAAVIAALDFAFSQGVNALNTII